MRTSIIAIALATAAVAGPVGAAVTYTGFVSTPTGNEFVESLTPIVFGDGQVGGGAGPRLITAFAQTEGSESLGSETLTSSGGSSSAIDLSSLIPFADRVSFKFTFQVAGFDDLGGDGSVFSSFDIGYFEDGQFTGITGNRQLRRENGGPVTLFQGISQLDGMGGITFRPNRYRGRFSYTLTVDPSVTPTFVLSARSFCAIQNATAPAYCNNALGFSSTMAMTTSNVGSRLMNPTGNLTALPEPGTWALMIIGFGLIGGVARQRAGRRVGVPA